MDFLPQEGIPMHTTAPSMRPAWGPRLMSRSLDCGKTTKRPGRASAGADRLRAKLGRWTWVLFGCGVEDAMMPRWSEGDRAFRGGARGGPRPRFNERTPAAGSSEPPAPRRPAPGDATMPARMTAEPCPDMRFRACERSGEGALGAACRGAACLRTGWGGGAPAPPLSL